RRQGCRASRPRRAPCTGSGARPPSPRACAAARTGAHRRSCRRRRRAAARPRPAAHAWSRRLGSGVPGGRAGRTPAASGRGPGRQGWRCGPGAEPPVMNLSNSPRRMRTVAGLVGAGIGLALVTGLGPGPSLLAAASGGDSDDGSSTSTSPTTQTTAAQADAGAATSGDRVVDAAGAGTVTFRRSGTQLTLVSAVPARGWRVEVEQAAGVEIEVDVRQGTRRVQVNL